MPLNGNETHSISGACQAQIRSYIESWLGREDSIRSVNVITHITTDVACKLLIRNSLSVMDDRFYANLDALKLQGNPIRVDWGEFAVLEIMKMLREIYWIEKCSTILDNEQGNDFSDSNDQLNWINPHAKLIEGIRKACAKLIWAAWTCEVLRGPRYGLMLVLSNQTSMSKILLISHILNNVLHYGYPKGKPIHGEKIIDAVLREPIEEIGIHSWKFAIFIDEDCDEMIKKSPHIGPISKRQSRDHFYLFKTTPTETEGFQPKKNEIADVVWYPINKIPCCDTCKIPQKHMLIRGSKVSINYHMVTLRDVDNSNPAILDILHAMKRNGNPDAFIDYFHAHRKCGHDLTYLQFVQDIFIAQKNS